MNDRRISLTRLLAVNWYGFRQIIDVTNDTLISGAFGTGKSALLDLIQYVMLGEHWRPNRAAAGNARGRSLVSYCLCDTNTTREGEPHYTRRGGVTIAGLEFTWPAEPGKEGARRETWGVRLEFSSPTSDPKRTYFLIPERAEWTTLAPDGQLLDEEQFRTFLRREYGREFIFPRQQDFLAEMATPKHLYFDSDQLHRTMSKAIAFEPEENIERFIREFILEESPLNVRDVQAAVGAYRDTQARLEKQEDEAAFLRRICDRHAAYEQARRAEAILTHASHALANAQAGEALGRHQQALARLQDQYADDLRQLDTALQELAQVRHVIDEVRLEASRDPDQVRLDTLQRERNVLQTQVESLSVAAKAIRQRLDDRWQRWTQWLKHGASLTLTGLAESVSVDDALLNALRRGPDEARLAAIGPLAARFRELFDLANEKLEPLRAELKAADARLQQIARDLESLDQKRMPGSFPLFEAVQQRLGGRAEQLARLIEVRPEAERWWPALELTLGRHRWSVIVERADYPAALEVLRRTPAGREGESLVNPSEALALELRTNPRQNSLVAKVEMRHEVAHSLVHHLLGDVICVETAEELDRSDAPRAITPEGISKEAPFRRRLKSAQETALTLGRAGLERMRHARERDQVETQALRDSLNQRIQDVHAWLNNGKRSELGDPTLPDRSSELPGLPGLERKLSVANETIQLLTTPEREARLKRLRDHEQQQGNLNQQIGRLTTAKENFNQRSKVEREAVARAQEDLDASTLAMTESRVRLPAGILDAELDSAFLALRDAFPTWSQREHSAQSQAADARVKAANERNARDTERRALTVSERHPEYRHDFAVDEEGNDAWAGRLRLLEETELPKFRALAAERRKDWEQRLQEQVLDRLNENLRAADRTVRQLRDYLESNIGRHRYRITQRRDSSFGALWRLLDVGLAPTDPLMQGIKNDEIERAKAELMAAVEAADKADERARRLLDYRHYHRYDMEMVLADRPDAPPISLTRSGRNLSGGESQAPFFISMLAAFHRVYDLGSARSQHVGLVVMDEAFSKLSGDGVEDCLDLARNFQLQLVMAFPIDRLGVMAPFADTIVICRKEEVRDAQGYVDRVDNIPTVLTAAEVEESLA